MLDKLAVRLNRISDKCERYDSQTHWHNREPWMGIIVIGALTAWGMAVGLFFWLAGQYGMHT